MNIYASLLGLVLHNSKIDRNQYNYLTALPAAMRYIISSQRGERGAGSDARTPLFPDGLAHQDSGVRLYFIRAGSAVNGDSRFNFLSSQLSCRS
jgi:hypothetical protein